MEQITQNVLAKAISLLKALKAEYIIRLPNEPMIKEGSLEAVEPKIRKKRGATAPIGTYKNFLVASGFDQMMVGDVLRLEPGALSADSLRSSAVSRGCSLWGNGSIMSTIKNNVIEVMRLQ
jgi:hypothetical protein